MGGVASAGPKIAHRFWPFHQSGDHYHWYQACSMSAQYEDGQIPTTLLTKDQQHVGLLVGGLSPDSLTLETVNQPRP